MSNVSRLKTCIWAIITFGLIISLLTRILCWYGYDKIEKIVWIHMGIGKNMRMNISYFDQSRFPGIFNLLDILLRSCRVYQHTGLDISMTAIYVFISGVITDMLRIYQSLSGGLWMISLIYLFYPNIKDYWALVRPDWISVIMKNIESRWSASFESLPPSLEPYDNSLIDSPMEERESVDDQGMEENMDMIQETTGDWLVFDPTYGVIQQDMVELWKEQAAEADRKLQEIQGMKEKRKLPPVRFSHQPLIESNGEEKK